MQTARRVLLVSSDLLIIIGDRVIRPAPDLPADTQSLVEAFEALGWEVTIARSRESLLGDAFLGCRYQIIVIPFLLGNVGGLPTKLVFSFGILFELLINIYLLHKKPKLFIVGWDPNTVYYDTMSLFADGAGAVFIHKMKSPPEVVREILARLDVN